VEEELGRFQLVQLNTTGKEEDEEEEGKVDIYLSLFYTLDIYIFLSFISFPFFFFFFFFSCSFFSSCDGGGRAVELPG
jgi:hypothetical protein